MTGNKGMVDLHTHTTASDGRITPKDLVIKASQMGLRAIAITDHDTVCGVEEAVRKGKELGIEIIPGIELTCRSGYQEFHILGYFVDYQNRELLDILDTMGYRCGRKDLTLKDYIAIILDAGGVPVLAHPAEYGLSQKELGETIKELKGYGLMGIEIMHPSTPNYLLDELKRLAEEYDLCITGGSDYHNLHYSAYELGIMNVDYAVLSQLKSCC